MEKTKQVEIIFLNHQKSQCGVYEIGKRIYNLLDKKKLNCLYFEIPINGLNQYKNIIEEYKPKYILYNFFSVTMPYANKKLFKLFPNTKHIGIIHDPLSPSDINFYNENFDCWIIHDDTNEIVSKTKFKTVRPIIRYEKQLSNNNIINIGSHGFNVSPWKMFKEIVEISHSEFDEVNINLNITKAEFGNSNQDVFLSHIYNVISKPKVKLNITNTYFKNEIDLVNFLSKNDLNVYFYNPPHMNVGVGGSADLAVSSQSSLAVNNTYMYRHFHKHLGFYEQSNSLKTFLNNKDKVKEIYELWSPERITNDYKKMIESI